MASGDVWHMKIKVKFLMHNSSILWLTLKDQFISENCIEIKIVLNFYFHTSLWCLRRFYEAGIILDSFSYGCFCYLDWVSSLLSSVSLSGIWAFSWLFLFVCIITFAYRRMACLSEENTLVVRCLRQKTNKKEKHINEF